jgi:hypothetical protein
MESKIESHKRNINDLENQLKEAKQALDSTIKSCNHQWSKPTYVPIATGGYTVPGDPPGTMGVDWRPSFYVPKESSPRWKRTCFTCGHIEYTISYTEETVKHPRFV